MKIAIIGSRSFSNYDLLKAELSKHKPTLIVSGGANGADKLGEKYADEFNIKKLIFKANWKDMSPPCVVKQNQYGEYNALAGMKRNTYIIENSDLVIAFWDGKSTGTKDSINKAKLLNKEIIIIKI